MDIFIGSSSEQLPVVKEIIREIKETTDKYDIRIESWKDWFAHGRFIGWNTWKIIQEALNTFDIAIMLLAEDDNVQSRGKEYKMTRDNVLLEAGAFAHKCGMENVILLVPNDSAYKLPTDFLGLNCVVFDYERGADNTIAYKKIYEKISAFFEESFSEQNRIISANIKKTNTVKKPKGKLI